jgi:hypothetical protein
MDPWKLRRKLAVLLCESLLKAAAVVVELNVEEATNLGNALQAAVSLVKK